MRQLRLLITWGVSLMIVGSQLVQIGSEPTDETARAKLLPHRAALVTETPTPIARFLVEVWGDGTAKLSTFAPTPTDTPTATSTPTDTPTNTPTATSTRTPVPSVTAQPTYTLAATYTPSSTPDASPTPEHTEIPITPGQVYPWGIKWVTAGGKVAEPFSGQVTIKERVTDAS